MYSIYKCQQTNVFYMHTKKTSRWQQTNRDSLQRCKNLEMVQRLITLHERLDVAQISH